jgi:hypothetical protein
MPNSPLTIPPIELCDRHARTHPPPPTLNAPIGGSGIEGQSKMRQEYRAYTVGSDGHFMGFEPLTCTDDAEAIGKTKWLVHDHDIELWCGTRLVIRLKAK